ncbi:alpha/beta hydrolase [Frigoriglobus tundricola]|uniref:Serine aminopeptidase S33 domain-containing protein n=1 Tax=Frigoriglobus tundricola TaxID=2774151 RepID=A0A6M5YSL7_9BACT|nr:hypothetical protein [Frigoriglobus tundricola]QJW96859.1 hypothetical protein FTUN_4419 [Frigoriglobus tundricola]
MRRWMAAPLVFAVAVGVTSLEAPRAGAQPKDENATATAETIRTADGIELHGLFFATQKNPTTAPVVVYLYAPGPDRDMTKGDWGSLTKQLNKEGYHVFQFDWRGHGKSTSIKDPQKFWGNPYLNGAGNNFNSYIKGGAKVPLKNTLYFKDITKPVSFMPAYLNDLAAVRFHLDSKNDNKELNTSSIYIVGAGDAASLGMAWLTAEWKRPATFPNETQRGGAPTYEQVPQALVGGIANEGGADFGGAVWLTATHPPSFPVSTLKRWISNPDFAPKIRENNPMLFMYAEKDTNGALSGKQQSEMFFNQVLVANPQKNASLDKLEQTRLFEVKGAEQLQGVKLLGQNTTLKTEDTIVNYFAFIQKARAKFPSKSRKYDVPYYIDTKYFELRDGR